MFESLRKSSMRLGHVALVSMLLAEEVDAEPDELAALKAADRENKAANGAASAFNFAGR